MSTLTPQQSAEYCRSIVTNAQREMATIAKDKRFNAAHKQQELARIRNEANAKIEDIRKDAKTNSEQRRADLALKGRYNPTPSEGEASQLLYAKSALEARWHTMTVSEMSADWQAAIATKDTISAKVYRDFSARVWQAKHGKQYANVAPGTFWQELAAASEALILPSDVLKARTQLAAADGQDTEFLIASRTAMIDLQQSVLSDDHTAIASVNPIEQMVRSSF